MGKNKPKLVEIKPNIRLTEVGSGGEIEAGVGGGLILFVIILICLG
jgi:hypothetical protein